MTEITTEQLRAILNLFPVLSKLKLKNIFGSDSHWNGAVGSVKNFSYTWTVGELVKDFAFTVSFPGFPTQLIGLDYVDSPELVEILNPSPPQPTTKTDDGPSFGVLIGSAAVAAGAVAIFKKLFKKEQKQTVKETKKVHVEHEASIKV